MLVIFETRDTSENEKGSKFSPHNFLNFPLFYKALIGEALLTRPYTAPLLQLYQFLSFISEETLARSGQARFFPLWPNAGLPADGGSHRYMQQHQENTLQSPVFQLLKNPP